MADEGPKFAYEPKYGPDKRRYKGEQSNGRQERQQKSLSEEKGYESPNVGTMGIRERVRPVADHASNHDEYTGKK
jgi:hypothetical protein